MTAEMKNLLEKLEDKNFKESSQNVEQKNRWKKKKKRLPQEIQTPNKTVNRKTKWG